MLRLVQQRPLISNADRITNDGIAPQSLPPQCELQCGVAGPNVDGLSRGQLSPWSQHTERYLVCYGYLLSALRACSSKAAEQERGYDASL